MDGSQVGELEYENFNAASAEVPFTGVHRALPKEKWWIVYVSPKIYWPFAWKRNPEHTEGYEGFYHLHHMEGKVEKTLLKYIIRDHDFDLFEARKTTVKQLVEAFKRKYEDITIEAEIKDQYYNMKEKITPVMHIVAIAEEAMTSLGITHWLNPSVAGLMVLSSVIWVYPANIFAGGHHFHGRYEYVTLEYP